MAIDYLAINPRATNLLLSVKKHVPSIDQQLKSLIELRVSQINGCAYCVDLHSQEARSAGGSQQRLDCLQVWRECALFSGSEMAALQWAESVTNISTETGVGEKLGHVLEHFSETEAVDLTLIISLMNCMNRMAISFGDKSSVRTLQHVIGPMAVEGAFMNCALSGFGTMSACNAGELCAAWVADAELPSYARDFSLSRHDDAALMAQLEASSKGILQNVAEVKFILRLF